MVELDNAKKRITRMAAAGLIVTGLLAGCNSGSAENTTIDPVRTPQNVASVELLPDENLKDVCQSAFDALHYAMEKRFPDSTTKKSVWIPPSSGTFGVHPDILFRGRVWKWMDVVIFIQTKCKEWYDIQYAGDKLFNFDDGVSVVQKAQALGQPQAVILPQIPINEVKNNIMFASAAIVALGLAYLGAKKVAGI